MKTYFYILKNGLLIVVLLALSTVSSFVKAQTTLVAGDIAFTGYNSNNNGTDVQNDFSFVILRAEGISASTNIKFTDNGYKVAGTNALGTAEGTLSWTTSSALAQFTHVYIKINPAGNAVASVSKGSIAGGFSNFILSQGGDQILAYQGTSASPTFISGIHMNGDAGVSTAAGWDNLPSGTGLNSNRSDIPPGLTNGVDAIVVIPNPGATSAEKDNAVYNCTGSTGATLSAIRTAINNVSNWNIQDVTLYAIPPSCSIAVESPLTATISGTDITCYGLTNGAATVSVSGGVGSYTYDWTPGTPTGDGTNSVNGLALGEYTVTITDGASTEITRTISIAQPAAITSSITSQVNVTCNGGSIGSATVGVMGGTIPYSYSWAPSGGTGAAASDLTAGTYTVTITDDNGCTATQTVTITEPTPITMTNNSATIEQTSGDIDSYNADCGNLIARVLSNGANPIAGSTTAKVWIDADQNTQFVKRHYEITPTNNAGTATGKVTLYFTQAEFNAFNAVNSTKLPIDNTDADNNKANLLIEKRGGTGDANGTFASYTGTIANINPDDNDIVWNSAASVWEVSFDVTGFSGFFVKTQENPLPVYLISFTAKNSGEGNELSWKTETEKNASHFEVEKSLSGKTFSRISVVTASNKNNGNYHYQDAIPFSGVIYYRLKMVDIDGSFAYSRTISLAGNDVPDLTISPNPAIDIFFVDIPDEQLIGSETSIYNTNGMIVAKIKITARKQPVDASQWRGGIYLVRFANGKTYKLVKM